MAQHVHQGRVDPESGWAIRSLETSSHHGHLELHLTQLLTGHGCLASYLHRIGKRANPSCAYCTAEVDDAAHTLLDCQAWEAERVVLAAVLGRIVPEEIGPKMLGSIEAWTAVRTFAFSVISRKEQAEREWEAAGGYGAAIAAATT